MSHAFAAHVAHIAAVGGDLDRMGIDEARGAGDGRQPCCARTGAQHLGFVIERDGEPTAQVRLPLIDPFGSRRLPQVFVMEPTDAWQLHHPALARWLHTPRLRRVLSQRCKPQDDRDGRVFRKDTRRASSARGLGGPSGPHTVTAARSIERALDTPIAPRRRPV